MDTKKEVNIIDKDKYAAIGSQSNDKNWNDKNISYINDLVVLW